VKNSITTERLLLDPISSRDAELILELLNTEGWLQFIGSRNVNSIADALLYIEKIEQNPAVNCWTVRLKNTNIPIGMISLVKKDYLDFEDIGFAFLPKFGGKGYAYESASKALAHFANGKSGINILAATVPGNHRSIKIIEKLGLKFEKTIERTNETLSIYRAFIS
jgi:[ribosomal protein S5]-alanine N-acetyltransferase